MQGPQAVERLLTGEWERGRGGKRGRPEVVFVALGDLLVDLGLPYILDPVIDVELLAPDLGLLSVRNPKRRSKRRFG
jgi:hypothetical protein